MDSTHFRNNATSFCGQWLATAYSTYSENVRSFCLAGKVAASPASEFTDWAKFASDSAAVCRTARDLDSLLTISQQGPCYDLPTNALAANPLIKSQASGSLVP